MAAEVRTLAERSATAASEITDLSDNTMATARVASSLIGVLVPEIKKTADLVPRRTSVSREQSVGVEQNQEFMPRLDTVIQGNAGASEEMAVMASGLVGRAALLTDTIAYCNPDGVGASHPV